MPLYLALKKLPLGGGKFLPAGSLVPQAKDWRRLDVSVDRGEVLPLPDETVQAIVRAGLTDAVVTEIMTRHFPSANPGSPPALATEPRPKKLRDDVPSAAPQK